MRRGQVNVRGTTRLVCAGALAVITVMLAAPPASAQEAQPGVGQEPESLQDSCQSYVQDFYNWYVAGLNSDTFLEKRDATWVRAVKIRKDAFSAELAGAIEKDGKAQAKHPQKKAGLDFDPFLGTKDRDDRYVTGFVKVNGNACRVEMYGYANDEKREDSNVTAELNWDGKRWTLVNFRYPNMGKGNDEGEDLLSVLKAQRKQK
jgi:Protein of unknown function (DUF3828)